jgi:hypothetical protein
MLYDIPTSLRGSDLSQPLPCSEEQWSSPTPETCLSSTSVPTPSYREAFILLFDHNCCNVQAYSEFGGYIMISGILSTILETNRNQRLSPTTINSSALDVALDNWQRLWHADPKSHSTGPSSPFGAMAFNASAVYRAACIRKVRDYSRYLSLFPSAWFSFPPVTGNFRLS